MKVGISKKSAVFNHPGVFSKRCTLDNKAQPWPLHSSTGSHKKATRSPRTFKAHLIGTDRSHDKMWEAECLGGRIWEAVGGRALLIGSQI